MAELIVKYRINPVGEYVNIFIHCKGRKQYISMAVSADGWLDLTGEEIRNEK